MFFRLKSSAGLLSNYEVLKLVQEVRTAEDGTTQKKIHKSRNHLANITFDVSY